MKLSPAQSRAARGLLGWSQAQLAERAKVSRATLAEFEVGARQPYDRTLADIQQAFEAVGVEFTNGGEPGVKLSAKRAALAEAHQYILSHAETFARVGRDVATPSERSHRVADLTGEADALRRAETYRHVEESLRRLRDWGFSLPTDLIGRLATAFFAADSSKGGAPEGVPVEKLNASNDE